MKNSYRFFRNTDCRYFPCHRGIPEEEFNCLFCYCPFYFQDRCPGKPAYIEHSDGTVIRDCTGCFWPHRPESYDVIIRWIVEMNKTRRFREDEK